MFGLLVIFIVVVTFVGVTIWELAEQQRPFYTISSNQEVSEKVIEGLRLPEPRTVQLPPEMWKLILSCWEADPLLRPSFQQICQQLIVLEEKYYPENTSEDLVP